MSMAIFIFMSNFMFLILFSLFWNTAPVIIILASGEPIGPKNQLYVKYQ